MNFLRRPSLTYQWGLWKSSNFKENDILLQTSEVEHFHLWVPCERQSLQHVQLHAGIFNNKFSIMGKIWKESLKSAVPRVFVFSCMIQWHERRALSKGPFGNRNHLHEGPFNKGHLSHVWDPLLRLTSKTLRHLGGWHLKFGYLHLTLA